MMICKKCNYEKKSTEFYSNDSTCKECRKKAVRARFKEKSKDPEFVKKERERSREKYHRLGYKEKQKKWDADKPWKNTSTYKNLSRKFKTPKGIDLHHWNYNDEFLEDVVLMQIKEHKGLHQLIELDVDKRIFKVIESGEWLDTRHKHLMFICSSGFMFLDLKDSSVRMALKNVNKRLKSESDKTT